MSPIEVALVVVAGFLAGVVNAIAGGGSLISFPMLLAVGFPSVTANVTNNIAMWQGYARSAMGFRTELEGQRGRMVEPGATTAAGGGLGAVLLLAPPSDVFAAAVPWCVLCASRPEERSAGKECGSTCSSPWSPS